jgi:hypothetical protein
MVTITVRLGSAEGEELGAFTHPATYRDYRIQIADQWYDVVGGSEGPQQQTLYVVKTAA